MSKKEDQNQKYYKIASISVIILILICIIAGMFFSHFTLEQTYTYNKSDSTNTTTHYNTNIDTIQSNTSNITEMINSTNTNTLDNNTNSNNVNSNNDNNTTENTETLIIQYKDKQTILQEYDKVILVSLKDKSIIIKDKADINEYKISTIGPSGSFYETPAGVYKIKTKEKTHYSSLGHVYMPYSMQFFGNFFIHGIPYYKDGTEVSSQYSGGCIRVDTDIMKTIYDKTNIGDTIVIVNHSFENPNPLSKDIENTKEQIKELQEISDNISNEKIDNILLALIALEVANVNNNTTLPDGTTIKTLKTLPEIINNSNIEYKKELSKKISGLKRYKIDKLKSIDPRFSEYTEYKEDIWDNIDNKVVFLNYIKENKRYVYKLIQ